MTGRFPDVETQMTAIQRGAVDLVRPEELRARLTRSRESGRPLRVKLGIDPTAKEIHLGHSVVIRKLRDFQELGHLAVLILGDGTALVGDPTGRDATRPPLTREQIEENVAGYLSQIGKILDIGKAEIVRNGDWFHKMGFADVLRLLARGTVARMLERDNFTDRVKGGKAIHLHELLYPLMQGWDSVMVKADVELGGTDQLFNLMQGRQLQEEEGQPPQVILTTPILEGLDGRKMSKSYGNHIGLEFAPKEIFGRTMAIPDRLLRSWFTLLTRLPAARVEEWLSTGRNPRDAKIELGKTLIAELQGAEAGEREAEAFKTQFSKGEIPADAPTVFFAPAARDGAIDASHAAFRGDLSRVAEGKVGFANFPQVIAQLSGETASAARQLMAQNAVDVDGTVASDPKGTVWLHDGAVLRVGKRRYFRIRVTP
jgi:tyrosyl-tRNA synthetase